MLTTTTADPTEQASRVTVLGLGDMGSAIAKTFIDRGHRTTVWNRTMSRALPMVDSGATAAASAAEAAAASPLVVLCLLDGAAVDEVLATVDAAVAGKVVVNLTSGSPHQARANDRWARQRGATYLDGKILGDAADVGTPRIMLSFSGSRKAIDAHGSTLGELGTVTYRGEEAGLAAVEFMAQVAMGYEILIGFLHTLRLVQAEGVDVAEFAERAASSVAAMPPLLTSIGNAVKAGEYPPDLGPLNVQAALMDDMISHRESIGAEAVRMREVRDLMNRRIADGFGAQGFSSLFELLTKS
ncbi:NAD(P)-dependent oxidoreductase [Micromonospora sp. CA-269861]|uniref:NAD(P)-dependent oxidoreductase n=1 Tax=Micromonospora sp. CA-269861 TaxID=3239968 RepID=UPI003D9204BE